MCESVELLVLEGMCVKLEFHVVLVNKCPCRMKLGGDCESEYMSTCRVIVMRLKFHVTMVGKSRARTSLGCMLLVLPTCR